MLTPFFRGNQHAGINVQKGKSKEEGTSKTIEEAIEEIFKAIEDEEDIGECGQRVQEEVSEKDDQPVTVGSEIETTEVTMPPPEAVEIANPPEKGVEEGESTHPGNREGEKRKSSRKEKGKEKKRSRSSSSSRRK